MIINPTAKGKRSEARILAEFVQAGLSVLLPWGEERYDLALDYSGRLVRIQCTSGWIRDGCIEFKTGVADWGDPSRMADIRGRSRPLPCTARKREARIWCRLAMCQGPPSPGCIWIPRATNRSMGSAGRARLRTHR